jgi:nicotinamide-nucleotide amidase
MRAEQTLARILKENNLTIALAESITCGLLSHKLGSISSTSDILKGAIICYDESVKLSLLKIPEKIIKEHTAESQIVTDKLALHLKKLIPADIHAGITGLASQGGSETNAKPVGTVYISVLFRQKINRKRKVFKGSPLEIKNKASTFLFSFISSLVQKEIVKS